MDATPPQPMVEGEEEIRFTPPHKSSPLAKVLIGLVILVLVAGIVIVLLSHHKTADKPTVAQATVKPATSVTHITATTKEYDSTNFGLGISYPSDWRVNDTDGQKLTIASPKVTVMDVNEQATPVQIVLSIQHQQTSLPQLAAGETVAAIRSQKISYSKPTPSQRAQTYVTFANYTGGSKGIDALYITGDFGYQTLQSIPMSDLSKADPLLSVNFYKCATSACTTSGQAVGIAASSWKDNALSKPLLQMIESLQID